MNRRIVVLTGGVGGAKLVLGLMHAVPPAQLTAIVNTGDDFRHLGLAVSPDIDTLLYTLSGQAHAAQGWGREGETWSFMAALRRLGGPDWFALGDGDLALHVLRSEALANGHSLSDVTSGFARAWGLALKILPMSDDRVATILDTEAGELGFQEYFVAQRCAPAVRSIRFEGAAAARPAPGVLAAIADPDTGAIIIAPSNPYLSIDPILSVPGISAALRAASAPVIAVSPVMGGKAVKGPTAKLMKERGEAVSARAIAAHYAGIIDGILADVRDAHEEILIASQNADTLMTSLDDKIRVAQAALALAEAIEKRPRR